MLPEKWADPISFSHFGSPTIRKGQVPDVGSNCPLLNFSDRKPHSIRGCSPSPFSWKNPGKANAAKAVAQITKAARIDMRSPFHCKKHWSPPVPAVRPNNRLPRTTNQGLQATGTFAPWPTNSKPITNSSSAHFTIPLADIPTI